MPDVIEDRHTPAAPTTQEPPRRARDGDTPAPTEREVPRRAHTESGNMHVRAADIEPYIGLRYLSRLFKLMAVVLILLLVSEVVTGFLADGLDALPRLLAEVSRLIVLAGLLWGAGDLAILLIDMGHDLRATRILIGRQLAHHTDEQHATIDPAVAAPRPLAEPVQPV